MSAREWKPGDVALVTSMYGTEVVAIRTGVPSNMGWAYSMDLTNGPGSGGSGSTQTWSSDPEGAAVIRPLAVIDSEDREQVERLTAALVDAVHDWPQPKALSPEVVADALREFANPTPPKPAEPTGIGAVVEDARGVLWVRTDRGVKVWTNGRDGDPTVYDFAQVRLRSYADITAVRVLSEGVAEGGA